MKASRRFIASASVLLAGSAIIAFSPAASASVSGCKTVPGGTVCYYPLIGEGPTPAAAEANALAQSPGCGDDQLVTGPEQLANGQWYVKYVESCINVDELYSQGRT